MSDKPPPMHERDEYRQMRDVLANFLLKELSIDRDRAWELANKVAPVQYIAVENACTLHHMNAVQGAKGMLTAIERIKQLDEVRKAVVLWAHRHRLTVPKEMQTTSERDLLAAIDLYTKTRAKDN